VGRFGFRVGVSASYSYKIIYFQFLPITGIIACPAVIKSAASAPIQLI